MAKRTGKTARSTTDAQATEAFRAFLRERGLRLTPQRQAVLAWALANHDHFDAEDLWAAVRRADRSASRATVYRTLALLVECGLLREVNFGDRARFEHVFGHEHHDHLICLGCGRVIEFGEPGIEPLLAAACRKHRFTPVQRRLQIRGYCAACRRRKSKVQS